MLVKWSVLATREGVLRKLTQSSAAAEGRPLERPVGHRQSRSGDGTLDAE
jgi:hypothetical protein